MLQTFFFFCYFTIWLLTLRCADYHRRDHLSEPPFPRLRGEQRSGRCAGRIKRGGVFTRGSLSRRRLSVNASGVLHPNCSMTLKGPQLPGQAGLLSGTHGTVRRARRNILHERICDVLIKCKWAVTTVVDFARFPFKYLLKLEQDSKVNGKDGRVCDSV